MQTIHETIETHELNEMLDEDLNQGSNSSNFIIINAIFGVLKNDKKCKDVTQIVQARSTR